MRLSVILVLGAAMLAGCSALVPHTRDNERANIYLQLAAEQFAERDFNRSIDSCNEALKFAPDLAPAYNQLALVYMETKRYQKAEESFLKALQIKPDYPEVQNNLGVFYNRQEQFQRAISHFQKALSYNEYKTPENAYTNMGFAYFRMGDSARAKIHHQKALDVVPHFCLAEKNMGDVYAKEKNFSKAADYYQSSVTNCPLYQESQYKLGLVMMKMGQKKVAKAQFEKLIQRHKKGSYVDRSNEVLKYLQ